MRTTLVLTTLACFLIMACSTDDNANPESKDGTGGNTDVVTADEYVEPPPPECPGLPDLTGRAYRVTALEAIDPTDKINEVWAADIAAYELVLVFHVIEHDVPNNTLKLEVTSAKAQKEDNGDGTFTPLKYNYMLQPSAFDAHLEGCRIRWSTPIELDIVTATISKPFHCFGITGYVDMSDDGTTIVDSWLSGAILESDAYDLCLTIPGMGVANFHWFMNLAHLCPEFDADKDDEFESYKFSGKLSGTDETELFDSGIVPFETDIVCEIHDEVCIPN